MAFLALFQLLQQLKVAWDNDHFSGRRFVHDTRLDVREVFFRLCRGIRDTDSIVNYASYFMIPTKSPIPSNMEESERMGVKRPLFHPSDTDVKNHDEDVSVTSEDALCELLGLTSMDTLSRCLEDADLVSDDPPDVQYQFILPRRCQSVEDLIQVPDSFVREIMQRHSVPEEYRQSGFCFFPKELHVPASIMRQLCNELVWSIDAPGEVDRTFESIKFSSSKGTIQERSTLTRLENLNGHHGWYQLCNDYIPRCLSAIMGEDLVLYKTKLNLKPAGGSGFAPHVDAPSLLVPFGALGPQTFVTVMIAIDDMTTANGCLRIAKGSGWAGEDDCPVISPEPGANPDAGGRAGAIPWEEAERWEFTDVSCTAGTVFVFGGWVPHRSSVNRTHFPRRAVFLTYNPSSEGDYYDLYYCKMKQLRNAWRASEDFTAYRGSKSMLDDVELVALTTIPHI
jgi:2-aminoethylphosphonate dioxygenase